ncbi:carboxy-S-adenosyl-L-methionine synthase CmoA [Alteromonadaceae bacterium M269]|nr:carboxy-S-adenosyl-L-methionine synthase CmoA [Alteromonadaceae bacterium M269]
MKDTLYAHPQKVAKFEFDENVAEVFPDMIERSVPGYVTIVDSIGQMANRYATEGSNIYDLGCSLGAVSLSISRQIQAKECKIIGIDNSEAMIERCKLHLKAFKAPCEINVLCQDILQTEIEDASVVVMNFTMQFIAPELRAELIANIYRGLKPDGVLIISEKLRHDTEDGNQLLIDLHHEFKRRNGYSELEISQKRSALEDVMLIDDFATHKKRLTDAGFDDVVLWFQCFNFASMVAIKQK